MISIQCLADFLMINSNINIKSYSIVSIIISFLALVFACLKYEDDNYYSKEESSCINLFL